LSLATLHARDTAEMSPEAFATGVTAAGLVKVMDGPHRRGHFDSVARGLAKLFPKTFATGAVFRGPGFR
jgi:pantoate--beta-alanine ligase